MVDMELQDLTGLQKATTLMVLLGVDRTSSVLQHLNESELEQVMLALSEVEGVPVEDRNRVLNEAHALTKSGEAVVSGGVEYARQILARAVGPRRGQEILERISARQQVSSFDVLRNADPAQVAVLLTDEHPQTIAVVLAYLDSKLTADILSNMPPELQSDVTLRLAQMEVISPQVVKVVEQGLKRKLAAVFSEEEFRASGGVSFLVKVLNQVDRGVQKTIFNALETTNPRLAEEIRANMFTFDDINKLDDRAIQRILRDINKQDLSLALKGAPDNLREHVYKNLSQRARENLKDEIELLGPQLARNVYAAQRRIVDLVRQLEEDEEIVIAGGGEGDEIIY
jgi:flagellar motor switch protein FliG